MKIGIIIWELNIRGGTQRQALELALYLKKKGHLVKIYTFNLDANECYHELMKQLEIIGVEKDMGENRLWHLPRVKRIFTPYYSLYQMKHQVEQLVKVMDEDFDIINCHDYGNVVAPAITYRKKYKTPVVWMANDLPTYHSRFRRRGPIYWAKALLNDFRGSWMHKHYQMNCIKQIDSVVVLDQRNKDLFSKHLASKATIIRSGLDIKYFSPPERQTLGSSKFQVLTTGIFFPHRRFEDVVEAMKILTDDGLEGQLDIVGAEDCAPKYAQKIRYLVEDYGIRQQVRFLGHVSEEELLLEYRSADAFVFPHSPQTWGLAVFEAMACGTPVIVSTGCGAAEVLTNGKNALLVPPESPQEIAERLKQLMQDKELWKKLSRNGRKFVEENIRWDLYGEKMVRLFKEVVKENR